MIEIRTLEREDLPAVVPLAREAVPALRLDEELLEEILLRDAGAPADLALAACDADELVGVACATVRVRPSGSCPASRDLHGHVKLLATAPGRRRQRIGTLLLSLLERRLIGLGVATIETDGAAPCYLQPGVPLRARVARALFEKSGYDSIEERASMITRLEGLDLDTTNDVERLEHAGILVRRARSADSTRVCERVAARFSAAWAEEVAVSIARSRPGVHLALDATGADLAGFACAGLWGRNAFGPMGTVDEKQGRGIGGVLLLRCLLDLRDCGEKDAVISWIGPERFYERRCAAETTLRYVALRKELRPGAPADGSPTDDESFDSRCPQSDASA